jgi:hypothetical protein
MEPGLMQRSLRLFACLALLSQSTTSKPRSPGEMAAADRAAAEKRAACTAEARARKLSYLQRRRAIKDCVKR